MEEKEDIVAKTLEQVAVVLRVRPKTNICPECLKKVPTGNLSRHIKENHGQVKKFKCTACNASYTRKEKLEQHICPK